MGNTCCQPCNNQQFQDLSKPSYLSDYEQSSWPQDPALQNQLRLSTIYNPSHNIVPLKHKVYNRWFWGYWIDGRPVGRGILYNRLAQDVIYYEGEFQGEPGGDGRVVGNAGQWEYVGAISKGKANGVGNFVNRKEGYQFQGHWKDSLPLKGTLTLHGGPPTQSKQTSKATSKANQISGPIKIQLVPEPGKTVISYPDGKIYKGEINRVRFYPQGYGEIVFPNNNRYVGNWYDGDMHGEGKFEWQDGSYYDGQYQYGRKEGMGKFKFGSTGNLFVGYWLNGRQHGKGILYDKQGNQLQKGDWKQGIFQQKK